MKSAAIGLYDDPAIYDLLFTPGTAAEVTGLERIARGWVRSAGAYRGAAPVWLEPACGTGRYLRVLAARGHRVCGFDRSPVMVDYARARLRRIGLARRARVFVATMQNFASELDAGGADFAFNPHNTIRHLDSDAAMLAHFESMAQVLRPGGIYAVGISLTDYAHERPDEDVWEARRGRVRVRQVVQYLPPGSWSPREKVYARREIVISHLTIERASGVELRDATYSLRCYDSTQWQRLLDRSPLRRAGLADGRGRPLPARGSPYALELLERRGIVSVRHRPS